MTRDPSPYFAALDAYIESQVRSFNSNRLWRIFYGPRLRSVKIKPSDHRSKRHTLTRRDG